MSNRQPAPLEPEAYAVAVYFFHVMLLLTLLASSYLPKQQHYPTKSSTEVLINDRN